MANICDNTFDARMNDKAIHIVEDFIKENFYINSIQTEYDGDNSWCSCLFESKWDFPEVLLTNLYTKLLEANIENINMRCLSVELGNDYVFFAKCNNEGWYDAY